MQANKEMKLTLTINEQDLQMMLMEKNNVEADPTCLQNFMVEKKNGLIVLSSLYHHKGEVSADAESL